MRMTTTWGKEDFLSCVKSVLLVCCERKREGGETDRQTDRQTGRQAGRDRQTETETDKQTDRDRETDRETDGQSDRQTDRCTCEGKYGEKRGFFVSLKEVLRFC